MNYLVKVLFTIGLGLIMANTFSASILLESSAVYKIDKSISSGRIGDPFDMEVRENNEFMEKETINKALVKLRKACASISQSSSIDVTDIKKINKHNIMTVMIKAICY
jgi:hypothetical protein